MSKVLKICPYCGKQVPEGTKVCPMCKRSLTLPTPVEKKPEATGRMSNLNEKSRARTGRLSRGALAVLIVSIVMLVAAIIVLATILLSGGLDYLKPSDSAANTPSPTFSVPVGNEPETTPERTSVPTTLPTTQPTTQPTVKPTTQPTVQPTAQATNQPAEQTPAQTVAPSSYKVTVCSDTVWIKGSGVNVRSGPGTNYALLGSVSAGYKFARTGTTDNGWSVVTFNGVKAFVYNDFLSTTEVSSSPAPTTVNVPGFSECNDTVTVKSTANIRTGPSTNDSIVCVAKIGTTLTRTGVSANWSRVTYNGQTCYTT